MTSMNTKIQIPEDFLCPITHDIMREPLMCRNGFSFECEAIVDWLLHHNNTCPLTRQVLAPRDLFPNRALKCRIESWCNANGLEEVKKDDEIDVASFDDDDVIASSRGNDILLTCLATSFEEQLAKAAGKRKEKSDLTTTTAQNHESNIQRRSLGRLFRFMPKVGIKNFRMQ